MHIEGGKANLRQYVGKLQCHAARNLTFHVRTLEEEPAEGQHLLLAYFSWQVAHHCNHTLPVRSSNSMKRRLICLNLILFSNRY